jgi:hypothetical protein
MGAGRSITVDAMKYYTTKGLDYMDSTPKAVCDEKIVSDPETLETPDSPSYDPYGDDTDNENNENILDGLLE